MIDGHLTRAFLELILFLEFSSDDVLHPDAAIAAMEQLAATLQGADPGTRLALARHFASMAGDYPDHEDFIASLGDSLGL